MAELEAQAFWQWFADHQPEFNSLSNPDEPFWDAALAQLKNVDERLWFELSEVADSEREFVITAEGHVDAFPIAEELVSLAPKMKRWKFVSLKPPMGFDFTTRYQGTLFEPKAMWFLPLESASRPPEFGMRVGVPRLESMEERVAHNAVLVILDTGLGERSAALDVNYTEVCELPPDPEDLGYIELRELATYIRWRKNKQVP
jgi:hypothetical protein